MLDFLSDLVLFGQAYNYQRHNRDLAVVGICTSDGISNVRLDQLLSFFLVGKDVEVTCIFVPIRTSLDDQGLCSHEGLALTTKLDKLVVAEFASRFWTALSIHQVGYSATAAAAAELLVTNRIRGGHRAFKIFDTTNLAAI